MAFASTLAQERRSDKDSFSNQNEVNVFRYILGVLDTPKALKHEICHNLCHHDAAPDLTHYLTP